MPTYLRTVTIPAADVAARLTDYPGNARRHDTAALDESVRVHGQYRSVLGRELPDGTIQLLGGHGTKNALLGRGRDVQVEVWDVPDDTQARQIVLMDNRSGDLAGYDEQALLALLDAANGDGGFTGTGYDDTTYRELLDAAGTENPFDRPGGTGDADPDEFDDRPPVAPITKPGDVWTLGPHRIVCGDCREAGVIEKLMDGARVNVAFTSPPYASQRKYDETSGFKPIHPDQYVDWFELVQAAVRSVLADDGSWFVNIKGHCDGGQRHLYVYDLVSRHVRSWGWRWVEEFVWLDSRNGMPGKWPNRFKDAWERVLQFSAGRQIKFRPEANGTPTDDLIVYSADTRIAASDGDGGGYHVGERQREYTSGLALPSNVVSVPAGGTGDHTAAFPVKLPQWFIRAYSDKGDAILDLFMGSGTTLVAAHIEGRIGYGAEISPSYVDVTCRRWQELTGELPYNERLGETVDLISAHDQTQETASP